jgi:hypothetical protein
MEVQERTRVDLPPHVPETFEVFVNGVRQNRGADYEVIGRTLVFPRPVAQEGKLGFWRWLSMLLGIAGSYRPHENVDIVFESGGQRGVVTGLKPVAVSDTDFGV